ncbi:hypothetical protein M513_14181, partial [Trichuris suis]
CSQAQTLNVTTRRRRAAIHFVPFPSGFSLIAWSVFSFVPSCVVV